MLPATSVGLDSLQKTSRGLCFSHSYQEACCSLPLSLPLQAASSRKPFVCLLYSFKAVLHVKALNKANLTWQKLTTEARIIALEDFFFKTLAMLICPLFYSLYLQPKKEIIIKKKTGTKNLGLLMLDYYPGFSKTRVDSGYL